MTILIDLTPLHYHLSGIERFAMCICEEMLKQDKDNAYILLFKEEVHERLARYIDDNRITARVLHGKSKLLFFQVKLLHEVYKIKADRYLFLAFPAPILLRKKNVFNTIHDMGRWDYDDDRLLHKIYFRALDSAPARYSRGIITVSEFSKKRIHEILCYPLDKILVAYNGISETISVPDNIEKHFVDIRDKYNLPDKYILYLSTLQPRKNLELLVKAYSEIADQVGYSLVLVGRNGWQTDELIRKYNGKNIIFTGFVDDIDLGTIYNKAMCFVFPSVYEGFGIPPIEALACGTPVLSSDSSCLPEILMQQADFFKDNDKDDLIEHLLRLEEQVVEMPNKLNEFQKRNYSYTLSAKKILDFII